MTRVGNLSQSLLLIVGMAIILGIAGYVLGSDLGFTGRFGAYVALAVAAVLCVSGPQLSPRLILRMYHARPIHQHDAPELYRIFSALVKRSNLPAPPSLYFVPSRLPNAFAVGTRSQSAVALTDGLLRILSARELSGVLAHELSHIRHGDTRIMAIADVFSRLTAALSQSAQFLLLLTLPFIVFGAGPLRITTLFVLLIAPVASTLLQLALSRSREFEADAGAVRLTGDPAGLASALVKLEKCHLGPWWRRVLFPGTQGPDPAVLRTHPATQDRLEALQKLAPDSSTEPIWQSAARRWKPIQTARVQRKPRWHAMGLWY